MKNALCTNCSFYSRYYKKWCDGFCRLNHGRCLKHKTDKDQFDTCEQYKCNDTLVESRSKRTLDALDQALKSINEIAHILREKEREQL